MKFILEEDKEDQILLKLVRYGDSIGLVASRKGDLDWYILFISNDGTLFLPKELDEGLGFRLDEKGRIKVVDKWSETKTNP